MNGITTTGIGLAGMPQTAYHCRICDKWFLRGNISCAVYHADGHCHYGDTEITIGEAYRTVAPRPDDAAKGGTR
jgi:hypothetical protein